MEDVAVLNAGLRAGGRATMTLSSTLPLLLPLLLSGSNGCCMVALKLKVRTLAEAGLLCAKPL